MNWSSLSLFAAKPNLICKGKIAKIVGSFGTFEQLASGRILVLSQSDIEEEQAQELLERRVKAIVHCGQAMSGVFPTEGPLLLLQQHVPIIEVDAIHAEIFLHETEMIIYQDMIHVGGQSFSSKAFTREDWLLAQRAANDHATERWEPFIEHTLAYAMREKQALKESLPNLPLRTQFTGRHVLIVSEGKGYKKDLQAASGFITAFKPVLLGIGAGADALLANGYHPDVVVSDSDQISKRVWKSGAEIIVHTYPDPQGMFDNGSPASLSPHHHLLPCIGNSEDAALLLAYEKGGEWLITVGVRSYMSDFVAKGLANMGSTLLVRMKIGARLVDIKSLQALTRQPTGWRREALSTIGLSCAFIGLSLFQLHWILKRASHVVWKLVGAE
ncbi:putative cytokinetic ring protein SteA [Paenibacillus qinlingensis]|uniref:putative cytokinetic ring protein SteA n=1 Tax=Paenibacillus qinlingensis TaxID=1837343 RepID=UPI00156598ED|nr:putative cytokinetic ring protein SteA [Paenibacillus qinlingensis]NQX58920.1 thiamine pyrophosphokinase [Paenibacillus qinlingensis]